MQNKNQCKSIVSSSEYSSEELILALKDLVTFGDFQVWDYEFASKTLFVNFKDNPNAYFKENLKDVPNYFIKNSYILPESLSDYNLIFNNLKKGVKEIDKNLWIHLPKGVAPICIRVHCINTFDKNGKPKLVHCVVKNITDIVNTEKNFKHRANSILKTDNDSLAAFSVNLSKNICNNASSGVTSMKLLLSSTTYDALLTKLLELIQDRNEGIRFVNQFSRGSLISAFEKGNFRTIYDHHLTTGKDKNVWVRTSVETFKNPLTNEIEAAIIIKNIQQNKIIEDLFDGIITKAYNFVGLVFLKADSFVLIDQKSTSMQERTGFIEELKEYIQIRIEDDAERDRILEAVTMKNLINMISQYGEYFIHFNTNEKSENNHHIVMRFSYLNDKRDVITVTCRDITFFYNEDREQKKIIAEALLSAEKANQAKSDFLSMISHDIRTPLSGIIGLLEIAKKEKDINRINEYLNKISDSSEYLLNIVNEILDVSKIETGRMEMHPEVYSSDEFLSYVDSIIRPICTKRNIHLNVKHINTVPYLYIDKLRLNQIIFNLLSITCNYTNFSGFITLEIDVNKLNDTKCITNFKIIEHGSGKNNALYNSLNEGLSFDTTGQYNQSEGFGLTLSYVKSFLTIMNGDISVEQNDSNETCIHVYVPTEYFECVPEELVNSSHVEIKDYSGYNFLLVEDNEINREIEGELLKSCGANVEYASNGKECIDIYHSKPESYYSAIFMDVRMPIMDGLEAARQIRNSKRLDSELIPIIALTANAMATDKSDCLDSGMNGYIAKPVDANILAKTINELIK